MKTLFLFCLFVLVLGIELLTLCLQGRRSAAELNPQPENTVLRLRTWSFEHPQIVNISSPQLSWPSLLWVGRM